MICPEFIHQKFGKKAVCEGDSQYNDLRKIHNTRFDYKPLAIIMCENEDDVVQVVNFCHKYQSQIKGVRVMSGGHQHEGMCSGDGVIVINLLKMNKLKVEGDTISVEPGTTNGQIYDYLKRQHPQFHFAGGACRDVCVGGLVLGGGWGPLTRMVGLTCDTLIEAKLVTADGNKLCLPEKSPDLFKAIKGGGGGNFGVITEYKLTLQKIGEKPEHKIVLLAFSAYNPYEFPEQQKSCIINAMKVYFENLHDIPESITSYARLVPLKVKISGQIHRFCLFQVMFLCADEKGYSTLKNGIIPKFKTVQGPHCKMDKKEFVAHSLGELVDLMNQGPVTENNMEFKDIHPAYLDDFSLIPSVLDEETQKSQWECEDYLPHKVSSAFPMDNETFTSKKNLDHLYDAALNNFLPISDHNRKKLYLSILSLGGAVKRETYRTSSSFAFRDKEFVFQFQAWWSPKLSVEHEHECIQWLETYRKYLAEPDHSLIVGAFINFPDAKVKPIADYYCDGKHTPCENYKFLQNEKTKVDKTDLFKFEMGIPPK